jgi:hypothetical protein
MKELDRDIQDARGNYAEVEKMKGQMVALKKAVYVDERRMEQRKAGFAYAKLNVRKEQLSEFM